MLAHKIDIARPFICALNGYVFYWHCHTSSHSTTPHPMNSARRRYTVVTLLYDMCNAYVCATVFLLHFVSDDVLVPRSEGQLIWIDAIGIPIDALGNKWPLKATKFGDFGLHFLCPEVFDFRFQDFLEVVVQPLGHKTINRFCHNWIVRGAEWSLHLTLIIGMLGCGWLVHA